MENQEPAVVVKDLYKTFKLPHDQHSGIKQLIVNFYKRKKGYEIQQVLNGVSFEIKKGEFFGIVGRNGSGKSTLLKLLAGIYAPDSGLVQVNGSLTPFIELGVGFNPELTGRENVFLNGALLGFSRKEMEDMYDDIVEFAELEKFMDQKLKNYSSGMQVRLAFSIAIRAQSDILLLDEVLAVGDEAFQRKCYEYFEDLKKNKKTVIIVTHDMSAVEKFCSNAILIEKGEIITSGSAQDVANTYRDILNPNINTSDTQNTDVQAEKTRWGDHSYYFKNPTVNIDKPTSYGADVKLTTDLVCMKPLYDELLIAYAVKDTDGNVLFGAKDKLTNLQTMKAGDHWNITFNFKNILSSGTYMVDLSILHENRNIYTDIWLDCAKFNIKTDDGTGFSVISPSKVYIKK